MAPPMPDFLSERNSTLAKVVEHVTGISSCAANFSSYLNGARKQLKSHAFLATNGHEILRRYKGLVEKFYAHGQDRTARALEENFDKIVTSPSSDVTLIYDMLRLCLELSFSPTRHDYQPGKTSAPVVEDLLSWEKIIAEDPLVGPHWTSASADEEFPTNSSGDTSDMGQDYDWDKDEEGAADYDNGLSRESQTPDETMWEDEVSGATPLPEDPGYKEADLPHRARQPSDTFRDELDRRQYWSSSRARTLKSVAFRKEDPCSLAPSIASYQAADARFYYRPAASTIYANEIDLCRECLYMLSGSETLIFSLDSNGTFQPVMRLTVKHLSAGALENLLTWFAAKGNAINRIRRFVRRICSGDARYSSTLQAFAAAIMGLLEDLDARVAEMSQKYQYYERPMSKSGSQEADSLLGLRASISDAIDVLDVVDALVGKLPLGENEITKQLLSALHDQTTEMEYTFQPAKVTALLKLLLCTMQPYVNVIDRWIYAGVLDDPDEQFFVTGTSAEVNDTEDWHSRYIIRKTTNGNGDVAAIPDFLRPVQDAVYVCGKSLNLVEQLDASQSADLKTDNTGNLYDEIVHSVFQSIENGGKPRDRNKCVLQSNGPRSPSEIDKLFPISVDAFIGEIDTPFRTNQAKEPLDAHLQQTNMWRPLDECLHDAVIRPIMSQRYTVGRRITSVLFRKCGLERQLRFLQGIYFMTAGGVMHPFCVAIFEKVDSRVLCFEPEYLNIAFAESLSVNRGKDLDDLDAAAVKIYFKRPEVCTASSPVSDILDNIIVDFRVPPPLMNIITASSMEVYNQVARILFRVKYARYRLDLEGWGENRGGKRNGHLGTNIARRKAAVKARLMHFVTGLYGFFNAVIHAECVTFLDQIRQAQGMDELITLHEMFVSTVRDRCLLGKKASLIWKHIAAPLELTIQYSAMCQNYEEELNVEERNEILRSRETLIREEEFSEKLQQLASQAEELVRFVHKSLDELASHGVPHLEKLAIALAW